jgi:hypothetical protein
MGSKWMRKLTEGDPERYAKAVAFQENIDQTFNFRGGRTSLEQSKQVPQRMNEKNFDFDSTITIAKEARLLAGFTEEEIDRLVKATSKSAAY